jgi:hypothetical protein
MRAPRSSWRSAARQSTSDCCRIRERSLIHNGFTLAHGEVPVGTLSAFHSEALNQKPGRSNRAHSRQRSCLHAGNPSELADRALGRVGDVLCHCGRGTDSVGQSSLCTTCLMLLLALGTHPVVQKNIRQVDVGSRSHSCAVAATYARIHLGTDESPRGLPDAT